MRFEMDHALEILSRTPSVVRAMLQGVSDEWTRNNEGPDTFSPFDVVGHLVDGEETDWVTRARIVLSDADERKFQPYDRFRHYARNEGKSVDSLLDEFEKLRRENLELIRSWNLGAGDFERTAMHPSLGVVTLSQLMSAWAVHDLGHIAQIARVMAKQYRDEAGPWIEYLPVLTDHEKPRS